MKEALDRLPGVARILWSARADLHQYLVEPVEGRDLRGELFRCAAAGNWELLELSPERLTLEEAFAILTEAPAGGGR